MKARPPPWGRKFGSPMGGRSLLGAEAAGEQGVRLEFGRPAVELADVTEHHSGAAVHGLDDAANLYVGVAVLSELADFAAIFREADDGEAALVVRGLRRADIEEASAVGSCTTS